VTTTEDRLKALMLRGLDGDAGAHRELLSMLASLLRAFYARRMAVHTRRASYSPTQPFTPWAYAMARYKLVDHLRRRSYRVTAPLDVAHDAVEPDVSEAATAGADLERLMSELPAKQRDAIRFVKLQGLSVAEAAQLSGQSESAIKVGIHRGLKALMARVRGGSADAD
jgi:RNA polymerase sigma-70 factor (ECF subfamily)